MDDQIDACQFANARSAEIEALESAIASSTKKSLLFQRLPFHKRRRTKSSLKLKRKNYKRNLARSRLKFDYPLLRTHRWFAKRFQLLKLFNSKVPLVRNMKSDKFVWKSKARGYLFDESFKVVFVYKLNANDEVRIEFKQTNKYVWNVFNEVSEVGYVVVDGYIIAAAYTEQALDDHFGNLEKIGQLYVLVSMIYGPGTYTKTGVYCKDEIVTDNCYSYINDLLNLQSTANSNFLFIKSESKHEAGKIITSRAALMHLWQYLTIAGYIPISIAELLRLGLENKVLMWPYDYPKTALYSEYEKAVVSPAKQKYERTPTGKRKNFNGFEHPWFIPNCQAIVRVAWFTARKGSFGRMAVIKNAGEVVGYVLRGGFCFSLGRCRGVCVLYKEVKKAVALNVGEKLEREIIIEEDEVGC